MSELEVLIVEDNIGVRNVVLTLLRKSGYSVEAVDTGYKALDCLSRRFFDVVITDYRMEPMDGMELLREVKLQWPATEVVMMTAFGSIEKGVEAIKLGAFDYITKPFQSDSLLNIIEKLVDDQSSSRSNYQLASHVRKQVEFDPIIGRSKVMLDIMDLVSRAARTDSTILVYGESGTGKELIAKSVHALSPRKSGPFVAINCGAIPENLQESELFGHTRGAFTDAHFDKKGLFESADGGTVFLDEIAETSSATQVKLLRFLENNEFRRVGENRLQSVDVRLIAATNKELEEQVENARFRSDLYYRINVIPFYVPPLRERKEDIHLLIDHFMRKYTRKIQSPVRKISRRCRSMLTNYDWPGNVRELENVIQRAVALSVEEEITPDLLPGHINGMGGRGQLKLIRSGKLRDYEKELILTTLKKMQGNKRKTAQELGISKATLWRKLKLFSGEELTDDK